MKHAIIFGLLLAASMHAYPHNVGRGSAVGAASSGASQGNGGRYSMVDEYQPWKQEEMKQYQKKEWTPYDGK
jgi:hypothetical protein